jgi:transposase InsO family protein
MPAGRAGKQFLVVARDYLSQWPEARALAKNDSKSVSKFIKDDILSRWGVPLKMSCDGGPENRGLVEDLQKLYGIERIVSSAYHPQGQGLIERGHKVLVATLKKLQGN